MKFFNRERKVRNGYLTAFALLMISYLLVFFMTRQMERRAVIVNTASKTIKDLSALLLCIKDSEIDFINYLVTHDYGDLESYGKNIRCAQSSIMLMRQDKDIDSRQKENFDSLHMLVSARVRYNNVLLDSIRVGHLNYDTLVQKRIAYGSETRLLFNALSEKIKSRESYILQTRTRTFESLSHRMKIIHIFTLILAVTLVAYSMMLFNKVSVAKKQYREQMKEGIEKLLAANNDLVKLRSIEKFATSGRIARAIAHEVRNPLTSISLAAEQLGSSIPENEDSSLLLSIITRNVNRIHDLILELLNSTKFSQLNLDHISVNTIVEQAIELAKDRIELHEIQLISILSAQPCVVKADREKLRIALLNLIINAIEAMEPGKGVLEISTQQIQDECMIMVKDNGMGMDEKSIARIFDPYFTQKENGSGLGLTLTQNIVLNHNGNISVDSAPGQGTVFTITLSVAEPLAAPP
jgi:signal transduction histidine kinase